MGSEVTPVPDDTTEPEPSDGQEERTLIALYRQYIGEPESHREVYVGFGAFFAGVALGLAALVVFLYSGAQPVGSDAFWQSRRVALVFGTLALPAIVISVPILLPVGRPTLGAGLVGAAVCLGAAVWLAGVYPYQWTGTGNDVRVISTYAVGLVLLAASVGSALVAQYVERLAPQSDGTRTPESETASAEASTGSSTASTDTTETVTDEQVAADIEEAMSDSTLTWGGVEQEPTTKRLELNTPDVDEGVDIDRADIESATETRAASDDVDDAVDGLRQLQGGEQKTARAESPDDQVDALTEFRRQKEADDELETGVDTDESVIDRLRDRLFSD
jgi:hypothetical protein